ncbi:MAG: DUF2470 domain-containing protein [Rhodospirillaceae bacterium]|nr:DUF2470 domain-containing protein [Rhodospirillaceae bacterium]MYH37601.1 DUF2470 domain-containing protein [Rhodospirillaceae bacterium]MYK13377.1 DUF2470 domain-containing protein [Rhodospirillaceae bacterium]MYK60100.1 DUF2470 domain-containing protein [Rhodospirillaceae bacterium]
MSGGDLDFARELARASAVASLATLDRDDGPPHASLVTVAQDRDLSPVLLLSRLARHRMNLEENPAAALLMTGEGRRDAARSNPLADLLADPLAGDRVTVRGTVALSGDPAHRARFLARHPEAAGYADFGDFDFFRMTVTAVHLVGGFGRIFTFDGADWPPGPVDAHPLRDAESDIVAHMNDDHADAVAAYATGLLGRADGPWQMTGIDPWGIDLRNGGEVARLAFDAAVLTPEDARRALVALVRRARAGSPPS